MHVLSSILSRLTQIAFYVGTIVTIILALESPYEHQEFITQGFGFWLAAELIVINATGFGMSGSKTPFWLKVVLMLLYGVFFVVLAFVFDQMLLSAFMLANTALTMWTIRQTEEAGLQIAWRILAYLFTSFSIVFLPAGELITMLWPEYAATSDPLYAQIMPNVGFLQWILVYYALSALLPLGMLFMQLFKRRAA